MYADAPQLFHGLTHRALPLVVLSAVAGLTGLALLARRRFVAARGAAPLAVASVPWAWGAAQYPAVLVGSTTAAQAAANGSVLTAVLASLGVGAVVPAPSLWLLYAAFWRGSPEQPSPRSASRPLRRGARDARSR